MNLKQEMSQFIKRKAIEHGFVECGISPAGFLHDDAIRLEQWLKANHHGSMGYMENHFDKRLDPTKLVEGAKSVVSFTYNYYTTYKQHDADAPKLSKYAMGKDYHHVIKEKLQLLFDELQLQFGEIGGRAFVDSAPVLERAWATKSGIGWIGKNGNVITKKRGSFFFLCELILDVELDYDGHINTDHCGTCNKCIQACPTNAILPNKVVDGSKCISYFTIELKDQIPTDYKGKFDNWMFGCDTCQDVCPWNRFSITHQEPQFIPNNEILSFSRQDWIEITEDVFNKVFKGSPVKRTKYNGLRRNIDFLFK